LNGFNVYKMIGWGIASPYHSIITFVKRCAKDPSSHRLSGWQRGRKKSYRWSTTKNSFFAQLFSNFLEKLKKKQAKKLFVFLMYHPSLRWMTKGV